MVNTSLKSVDEAEKFPPTLYPTTGLNFGNFKDAIFLDSNQDGVVDNNFAIYFGNTLIVGISETVIGTFLVILAAFAFARLNFKFKKPLFMVFLATMMIPGEMMVITNFVTVSQLGWTSLDTNDWTVAPFLGMTIPFLVSVFSIYQLRQTFLMVPDELYYAAKVDGVSDWKYLWKVMIPMSKSSLVTIIILKLMGAWNSFVWPNLVGNKMTYLITAGLRNAFTDQLSGRTSFHLQMAAVLIVTLPLLLVFFFCRKYILKGMSRSGIKG
jgi:multiple sugar transport system permease protein